MATIKFVLQKPYKERKRQETSPSITQKPNGGDARKGSSNGSRTLNPNETRIYACLIIDHNQVIKIKTEKVIQPIQWSFAGQKMKDKIAGSIEFNAKLADFKKTIDKEYQRILEEEFPPDIEIPFDELRAKLTQFGKKKEKRTAKKVVDLFVVLDEYLEYLKSEVTEGTRKKYITLKKSLKKFGEENKHYSKLTFSAIDHKFFDAYTKYLKNLDPRGRMKRRPDGTQRGLLVDTVGKYIETLKTFCAWASKRPNEKNSYNPYTYYLGFSNFSEGDKKRKKPKNEIVTLDFAELKKFYDHDFSQNPCLERVRDMFVFECVTGQRWSDIQLFDKSQIKGDVWSFTSQKTKQLIEIDMRGYAAPALSILKKYDYKFPIISNQKFNEYIKTAAKEAEIDTPTTIRRYVGAKEIIISDPKHEFITSHTARRSFVSILLNEFNVSPVHVMEQTGHTDLKTLQKYIKPNREARRKVMEKTPSITQTMKVTHKAV
jgi:integrase